MTEGRHVWRQVVERKKQVANYAGTRAPKGTTFERGDNLRTVLFIEQNGGLILA